MDWEEFLHLKYPNMRMHKMHTVCKLREKLKEKWRHLHYFDLDCWMWNLRDCSVLFKLKRHSVHPASDRTNVLSFFLTSFPRRLQCSLNFKEIFQIRCIYLLESMNVFSKFHSVHSFGKVQTHKWLFDRNYGEEDLLKFKPSIRKVRKVALNMALLVV